MNFNFFDQTFDSLEQNSTPPQNFQIQSPRNYDKNVNINLTSQIQNHDRGPPAPSKSRRKHSTPNYINTNNNSPVSISGPMTIQSLTPTPEDEKGPTFLATCPICNKSMRSKQSLAVHIKTHTKPHTCQICLKTYAHKFLLTLHEHAHTNKRIEPKKRFKCPVDGCDTAFNQQCRLTAHHKVHEGAFRCSQCHKMYSSNASLARHETVVHGQERPFKCPENLCGKSFCHPDYLYRHLRSVSHSGVKRFSCTYCERSYASQRSLNYHLLSSHSDSPGQVR